MLSLWKATSVLAVNNLVRAATDDWDEYPPYVQAIIEAEAKDRGLWKKVLAFGGGRANEPSIKEGNLEAFVCES